jgi:uncharacterized protein (TIGR01777 family)
MASSTSLPWQPLRIVLPGGSGHLGQVLARHFQQRGCHVTVLTRGPYAAPWQTVHWDGETIGPWVDYLNGSDVCINLAGRSVNCRHTARNRQQILRSRIGTTRLLGRVIATLDSPPTLWLNASTANIYRHTLARPGIDWEMDEATGELGGNELTSKRRRAPKSWDFSVEVARQWEAAFFAAPTPNTRKVAMRTAMVLSPMPGTPFAAFSSLVRLSLGGWLGSGRQFVSWIHEEDFARAVEFLIDREFIAGPVNLAAPNPIPNREFMAALRDAWDVPNGLPIPSPLIHLGALLLRTEAEFFLKSRRVIPGRLNESGFQFNFPTWPQAAEDLVNRWRNLASSY